MLIASVQPPSRHRTQFAELFQQRVPHVQGDCPYMQQSCMYGKIMGSTKFCPRIPTVYASFIFPEFRNTMESFLVSLDRTSDWRPAAEISQLLDPRYLHRSDGQMTGISKPSEAIERLERSSQHLCGLPHFFISSSSPPMTLCRSRTFQ